MMRAEFERMYAASDDPWSYRTRWYEERKRELLLATLPRPRFARACELGCANGELAALLATRCDELLATEGIESAVALARARTARCGHVTIEQHWHPETWPRGKFDLIVIGEIGYYLETAGLAALANFCRTALTTDGVVLACHWRHPIGGSDWSGDRVHRELRALFPWSVAASHLEADFVMETWWAGENSVAQMERIVA